MTGFRETSIGLFISVGLVWLSGPLPDALGATVYTNPWNSSAADGGSFSQTLQQLAGELT